VSGWSSNYHISTQLQVESKRTRLSKVDFPSKLSRNLDVNSKNYSPTPDPPTPAKSYEHKPLAHATTRFFGKGGGLGPPLFFSDEWYLLIYRSYKVE
jgi:hypothetical protein